MKRRVRNNRAFSILELLAIVFVLLISAFIFLPTGGRGKAKAKRIVCVNHLKQIGLGFRIFATDNNDKFPWQIATNAPPPKTFEDVLARFRGLSNEIANPKIFACPADNRMAVTNWANASRTNISYFVSLDSAETYPQSFVGGDRNLVVNGALIGPGIIKLESMTNASWDGTIHKFQGNCVMGDGSVQQLSPARLREQLRTTGQSSMRLAVP
jgi:hypothetical protein